MVSITGRFLAMDPPLSPCVYRSIEALGDFWGVIEFDTHRSRLLRLHLWVKYFYDLTRLNDGHNLSDLEDHSDVRFEPVVRRADDDDGDRPSLHRLLLLYSLFGGD